MRTPLVTVPGAAIPLPFGGKLRQIQIDLDPAALQARGLSGQDVANALAAQNLITPVGTEKIGRFEYAIQLNDAPAELADLGDLPIKSRQRRDGLRARRRAGARRQCAADQHRPRQRQSFGAVAGVQERIGLDAGDHCRRQAEVAARSRTLCRRISRSRCSAINRCSCAAAIIGVAREGVIAAALTSLMILLFLGSWRSTVIIATSIPLAVLGSIIALPAIGETLNIMTLGGLALAVGILVDDATVTIENINWHLEHGKQVETAIMDGARQIVTPAFVSLLCICIVFVPMFFLDGVARFLFVPMAEAVMFAMICSFILSRTLVPTMANYLLRAPRAPHRRTRPRPAPPRAIPWSASSAPSKPASSASARAIAASSMAMGRRGVFVVGFLGCRRRVVPADALSRPRLLSVGRRRPDPDARAHSASAPASRRAPSSSRDIENAIRTIIPPTELTTLVDNIGMPISGINLTYNNTGVIGTQDGDIQIKLTEDHRPTADYVRRCARSCRARFPGVDLRVSAGRHRQPDPQFRRAGADRRAGSRRRPRREFRLRQSAAAADCATFPASPTRASSSRCATRPSTSTSTARARNMSADRARRHQQSGRQLRRQRPGRADLLARSQERRFLFDRHADAAVPARFA